MTREHQRYDGFVHRLRNSVASNILVSSVMIGSAVMLLGIMI
jgi:hypothetical protein